jgi:DNA-binding NtrC family response regulator
MKRVLIVDDDAELRSHVSEILKGAGYETQEAVSGHDAVDKASRGAFDVILLDMIMPKGGGSETLNDLKKITPRSRIIMLTAFATIGNAVEAIKKGASDYLSKPFKMNDLLTAIRRVLEEASFDACAGQQDMEVILSSLSNPLRTKIMRLIESRKKVRLTDMTKELDIEDHTKVLFHLRILKQSGLVEQDGEKRYSLTKEGERAMSCLKILEAHLGQPKRIF